MGLTRICNRDNFSELYDIIVLNGRVLLFASTFTYKNPVGLDLQKTLQTASVEMEELDNLIKDYNNNYWK